MTRLIWESFFRSMLACIKRALGSDKDEKSITGLKADGHKKETFSTVSRKKSCIAICSATACVFFFRSDRCAHM